MTESCQAMSSQAKSIQPRRSAATKRHVSVLVDGFASDVDDGIHSIEEGEKHCLA